MLFVVERRTIAGRAALTVRGELDLSTTPQLEEAADEAFAGPDAELVIDLTHTTFLGSSGARTLLGLTRRARSAGVRFHVLAPHSNGPVRLTIDLLDLGAFVPLVSSASEIRSTVADRDGGT